MIACRNPQLAKLRTAKRRELLVATVAELEMVQQMVANGRLSDPDKIGVRVGRVINKYKMAKHMVLDIREAHFAFRIDEEAVAAEAGLDGIYVIRISFFACSRTTSSGIWPKPGAVCYSPTRTKSA